VDGKEQESIMMRITPWIFLMSSIVVNRDSLHKNGMERCTVARAPPKNQGIEKIGTSEGPTDALCRRLHAMMAISAPATLLTAMEQLESGSARIYPNDAPLIYPAIPEMENAKQFSCYAQR
jgi:hypothetical protein